MNNTNAVLKGYNTRIRKLLSAIDYQAVKKITDCFLRARIIGSTIFFVGNGGSAATASHFAQDIAEIGRKLKKPGFKTLSLTDRMAFITALANDHGYDNIFCGQMDNFFKKGDYLVAISASGNSPNVVKAAQYARKMGGTVIGVVGFDGGKLKKISDVAFHVKTKKGEYGLVEDVHMILDHMIADYFYKSL